MLTGLRFFVPANPNEADDPFTRIVCSSVSFGASFFLAPSFGEHDLNLVLIIYDRSLGSLVCIAP